MTEKRLLSDEELENISGGGTIDTRFVYDKLNEMGVIPKELKVTNDKAKAVMLPIILEKYGIYCSISESHTDWNEYTLSATGEKLRWEAVPAYVQSKLGK